MRWLILVVALGGMCSEPETVPTVEPVHEAVSDEPELDRDVVEDEAPEREPSALELPDEIPTPPRLPLEERERRGGTETGGRYWMVVEHPDEAVRSLLAATIEGLIDDFRHAPGWGYDRSCSVPLATEHLISVNCFGMYDVRGGAASIHLDVTYAIIDGALVPVSFEDIFLPGADIEASLVERCEVARLAAVAEIDEEDHENERDWMRWGTCGGSPLSTALTQTGVSGYVDFYDDHYLGAELTWDDLRDHIRADGPLAPVLGDASFIPRRVAPTQATGWAVTRFAPEQTLLSRWRRLDDVEPLLIDRFGGGLARLVLRGQDEGAAGRIAERFGAEATPVVLESRAGRALPEDHEGRERGFVEGEPVRWVRTTEDLNLRPSGPFGRSSAVLAVLPRGSLVVAIGGALRRPGSFVDVLTPLGRGLLASRHLRAYEECVPEAARRGEASVAKVRVRRRGSTSDAWLVATADRVELREASEDCALGEEILAIDAGGHVFDVRMTATTENGGSSILVVGVSQQGEDGVTYVAHRIGSAGPVLEETLTFDRRYTDRLVRLSETADGTYFPITIQVGDEVRRFTWEGERLEAREAQ